LNETSGTHLDATSKANNAAALNGVNQNATGKIGGADIFDGANDYVIVDNPTGGMWSGNYTVSLWVKAGALGQHAFSGIFNNYKNFGGGGTVNSFQLDVDGTNPGSYRLNAYTNNFGFNGSVVSTDWSYLTATVSDTTLSLYYNGTLTNNSTLSFSETKTFRDYLIGVNRGGDFFFKGTIDEVRLARNSVKSADWISTSYNNQNAPASFYSVGPEEAVFSGLQDFYLGVIADYQQAVPELNENNNTKVQSTPLIIN